MDTIGPPFHFINATNVLIYLRKLGQRLALYNLSISLRPGGYLAVTDFQVIYPWMESLFMKRYHGWLTQDQLARDFLLDIEDSVTEGEKTTYLFKKQA